WSLELVLLSFLRPSVTSLFPYTALFRSPPRRIGRLPRRGPRGVEEGHGHRWMRPVRRWSCRLSFCGHFRTTRPAGSAGFQRWCCLRTLKLRSCSFFLSFLKWWLCQPFFLGQPVGDGYGRGAVKAARAVAELL